MFRVWYSSILDESFFFPSLQTRGMFCCSSRTKSIVEQKAKSRTESIVTIKCLVQIVPRRCKSEEKDQKLKKAKDHR